MTARVGHPVRDTLPGVAAAGVLAVVVGVAWWALAPTPEVRGLRGVLVSDTIPEFAAAQDGTFALLAVAAGVLHGVFLLARRTAERPTAALGAVAGGLVGAVLAWQLGALLGPAGVTPPPDADVVVLAPLTLRAYGVLGIWPATVAVVLFAGLLMRGLSAAGDRGRRGTGEPHEVGRGELHVQPPAPGTHEHGG